MAHNLSILDEQPPAAKDPGMILKGTTSLAHAADIFKKASI